MIGGLTVHRLLVFLLRRDRYQGSLARLERHFGESDWPAGLESQIGAELIESEMNSIWCAGKDSNLHAL